MSATLDNVILFGSPISPFVDKVARALRVKRVPYTLREPQTPLDLGRWNPRTRKMPVLEIAGEREYDSTFILRRLDLRVPEPPLYAADPPTAARQRFLEDWSDESLYWYGMALRWCEANAVATADQIAATLPVPALVRPLLRPVLRWQIGSQAHSQGLGRLPLERVLEELARRLDELEVLLDAAPFFFATQPSAADLAVASQLRMLRSGPTPQAVELIGARPALAAYAARVDAASAM
jgi:glutathione S-transferase